MSTSEGMAEPDTKRQKPTSWRQKSIDTFKLLPVPDAWANKVPVGTEEAWKRYYETRIERNKPKRPWSYGDDEEEEEAKEGEGEFVEFSDIQQDEDDFGEEAWDVDCMNRWKEAMEEKVDKFKEEKKLLCPWKWTPAIEEEFVWEDHNDLRRGTYLAYVWSPFAIPHAVALEHYYYRRVYWSSMGFWTTWQYALVDFEDSQSTKQLDGETDYSFICSNGFDDEELRADKINLKGLNKNLVRKIRTFVYGDSSQACKDLTCSDATLLDLLFGSMGTQYDCDDIIGSWLGYCWSPSSEETTQLLKDGVPASDDETGPPENEYEYGGVTWLEHRVKEITNTLGPFSRNYRAPTIEDAPGYVPREDYSSDEDEDGGRDNSYGLNEETQNRVAALRNRLDPDQNHDLDLILRMLTGRLN